MCSTCRKRDLAKALQVAEGFLDFTSCLIPVLSWGAIVFVFETFGEVLRRGESHLVCDFCDRSGGTCQEFHRFC